MRRISGINLGDFGCMLRGYSSHVARSVARCREYKTFIPALATYFARNPVEIPRSRTPSAPPANRNTRCAVAVLAARPHHQLSVWPLRMLFMAGMGFAVIGVGIGALLIALRLLFGSSGRTRAP